MPYLYKIPLNKLALLLFFASGLSSLVYQVIWVRLLTLTFGAAAFAVATVLIAYMGGLCLGSFFFGRLADRRPNNLRFYAVLELIIAVYALIMPFILDLAGNFYVRLYQGFEPDFYTLSLIKLACSTLVIGVPTFLMGGTLPLLSANVSRRSEKSSLYVARLYAVNTIGAVVGCLLAGYLLIPKIGLMGASIFASFCNFIIFILAFMNQATDSSNMPAPQKKAKQSKNHKLPANSASSYPAAIRMAALLCLSLSGMCAMAYQTIWTRLLSMILGTTVYAFTLILASFLVGIFLGSMIYRGWFARNPLRSLAFSQIAIGIYVLGSMSYFDELPFLFLKLFEMSRHSWFWYQAARMSLAFFVLIIPTSCFGIAFPLVVEICRNETTGIGRNVGNIYAINTLGAIIGSFIGGFVLIPFLGIQISLLVLALINTLAGLSILLAHPSLALPKKFSYFSLAFAALIFFSALIQPWNLHYLNSGPYVYGHQYSNASSLKQLKKTLEAYQLKFFREDATATVSVLDINGTLSLAIDGKTDASTGENADMSTQILLSQLPAILARSKTEALLVGLGSGVSLGSLLTHPEVKHVDVLEISEAVVQASAYFNEYNYSALDDPRSNLILADARHHLLRSNKAYDIIISQPSNPWITGVSNLFTTEHYKLMRQRLSESGIVCQWIPSYHMSQEMLAVILKSFTKIFPHATLWSSSIPGDLFMVGSLKPITVDYPSITQTLKKEPVRQDLARISMDNPMFIAKTFKFNEKQLAEYIKSFGDKLPENTDMHPIVEFMTPQHMLKQQAAQGLSSSKGLIGEYRALLDIMHFEQEANRKWFTDSIKEILR